MMNPTPSKQEQIFEACDSLHKRGDKVTIVSVGQELLDLGYQRGSDTTRSHYIKEWRKTRFNTNKTPLSQRTDKLEQAIDDIRAEAVREAALKFEADTAKYQEDLAAKIEQINFAQQEINKLHEELTSVKQHNQELQHTKKANEDEINRLSNLIHEKSVEHEKDIIQKNEIIESNKTLIEKLETQLTAATNLQLDTVKIHQTGNSEFLEKMESQRHELIVKIEHLKDQVIQKDKDAIKNSSIQENLRSQLDEFKKINLQLEKDLAQQRDINTQQRDSIDEVKTTLEKLPGLILVEQQEKQKYLIGDEKNSLKSDIKEITKLIKLLVEPLIELPDKTNDTPLSTNTLDSQKE